MTRLRRVFAVAEATPFSSQAGYSVSVSSGNGYGNTGAASMPLKKSLKQVEDLLRKAMASGNNQALNRTINKFLVDITPYLGEP